MEIKFSKKYKNLFKLLQNDYPDVDTVLITGGRSSAKSFAVSLFSLIGLVEYGYNILYTRFTNSSIVDSIKPEVDDKIELLGYENKAISTNTHIEHNGNRIAFKGIKTGSKQQTANLKSLSGFSTFVVDEAEELPDYETFEKVFLSIRSKEKRNITILLLNPTSVHHWIFRHFYLNRNIEAGYNGIKDNVMYIHTSYLDVPKEYIATNIKNYYRRLKDENEKKYNQIVLGGWTEATEDRVFNHFRQIPYKEFIALNLPDFYGADWGKNHIFGIVHCKYDAYSNTIYCHELNALSENQLLDALPQDEVNRIKTQDIGGIIVHTFNKLAIPKNKTIICDSAVPDNILMLRRFGWEYAIGIDKPKGSVMAGITLLQSTNVYYTDVSKQIDLEHRNYAYAKDRLGIVDDEIIKQYDDLLDPIRYVRRYINNQGLG
jgi:phage terminase large subunit